MKKHRFTQKLRSHLSRRIVRDLTKANPDQLPRHIFNTEDRAWLQMRPVGREFGASLLTY